MRRRADPGVIQQAAGDAPSRGGNRQANSALYRIVLTRMSNDERTKTYVAKRTAEGKTIGEIAPHLERVAQEVYPHLPSTMT